MTFCFPLSGNVVAQTERGFTILEVLITAAIIGVITGIVALNYGSFNNLILLKNQAYQIALELREMQTRSLSATGGSTVGNNEFRRPYGIYFATATPGQYTLFLDGNSNGVYNAGEELEVRRLDSRFRIIQLRNGNTGVTTLSVTFRRPNFDAIVNNGSAGGTVIIESISGGTTRQVLINPAGQINVD